MELFKLFTQAGKLKWTAAVRGLKTKSREQWTSGVAVAVIVMTVATAWVKCCVLRHVLYMGVDFVEWTGLD